MKKQNTFLIVIFLLTIFLTWKASGQDIEKWASKTAPYEKLYLHLDREFYFLGEEIWFKAYLVEGVTHNRIAGGENLHVELLDKNGNVILHKFFPCENGLSSGNITVPQDIESGSYFVRAYTDCLKNFGEDAFFYKAIKISEVKNSSEIEDNNQDGVINEKIEALFLPEGGVLFENVMNTVVVKVLGEDGLGKNITGFVKNQYDDTIVKFSTDYNGMEKFFFTPEKGSNYYVIFEDYPEYRLSLDKATNAGVKIHLASQNSKELIFGVLTSSEEFRGKTYYLACMFRGNLVFYQTLNTKNEIQIIKIKTEILQGGINRFVLLNSDLKPVSERLVFCHNLEINKLQINTDKENYESRNAIRIDIEDSDSLEDEEYSLLSMAVIDENSIRTKGESQNIKTWFLLNSELKGNIENVTDYFVDDENMSSVNKLDLLMLTNGWSKYVWNNLQESKDTLTYTRKFGISVEGHVKRLFGKKSVEEGEIIMGLFKNGKQNFLTSNTDKEGRFSFKGLIFADTAQVFVQARKARGGSSTEVTIDKEEQIGKPDDEQLQWLSGFSDIPLKLYRQKFYSELAQREFNPESYSILLGEINVTENKKEEDDGHFRIYGTADYVLEISDDDYAQPDILQYLNGRVPGLRVNGDQITMGGPTSFTADPTPKFVVDGFSLEKESALSYIRSMSMSNIDKIEVLKSASNTAIFGVGGANGVIAIYTKSGNGIASAGDDYLKGAILHSIQGFSVSKEFYSPKYTIKNIDSPKPDNRTTLYWNPNILTKENKSSVSFFTSDDISKFKVFVEGITNKGRICVGTAEFTVDKFRQ